MRDIKLGMIGAGTSEIMRFLIQREVYKEQMGGTEGNRHLFFSEEENTLRENIKDYVRK